MKSILAVLAFALLCALTPTVRAQERTRRVCGRDCDPINGPAIQDGVLIIQRGKITAVGARSQYRFLPTLRL